MGGPNVEALMSSSRSGQIVRLRLQGGGAVIHDCATCGGGKRRGMALAIGAKCGPA